MKSKIHPQFFTTTKVVCACGNTFITGSIVKEIHTEVCSNCHPFYTGKQKLLDTTGVVDKFKKKMSAAASIKASLKPKKERKARTKK